jgi:tRNA(adenine34) deaminase
MAEALAEARKAGARGEVPIGAVLLSGHGEVLARAGNEVEERRDPTAHAEVMVIRAAAAKTGNHRLEGGLLAVTLEPCLMCAGASIQARLSGLVYGASDSKAGALDSRFEAFEQPHLNHKVWRMGRICEEECADLLDAFYADRR